MSKIGYNIDHDTITNPQRQDVQSSQADMHLIMCQSSDAPRQIQVWKDNLGAERIIWRKWDRREGNWTQYPNADEIVKQWLSEGHLDIIRDDPCNEPSLAGYDIELNKRYVASRADLLDKAHAMGIKVAVGAFSVGTPHENLISEGIYDDLIRAVVAGGHYISVHEYCPGIPSAGDTFAYDELLDPANVRHAMNPFLWELSPYWLLRRSDRFIIRARQLGLSDPQIIVTECFIDDIGNVGYKLGHTIWDAMKNRYAIAGYDKLKGVLAWRSYYADAFPDMTYDEAVTYLTRYVAENVYSVDWIKGVCLFAINANWEKPRGHNWGSSQLDNFRRFALPEINTSLDPAEPIPDEPTEPQPLPVFTMRRGFLHSIYPQGSNIRAGFNTRTQVIATIGIDPMAVAFSNETVENDGFKWHKVVITDLVGYIAKTEHIHFEPIEDTPPEPEPPQDDHVIITKDTAKAIAECYLSIMKANAKLYEIFAELGGVLTVSALDGVVFSDVSAIDSEVASTLAILFNEDEGEAEEPAA